MNNRMFNCTNPYQGAYRKVLCLCSAGLLRSPTMAWVLSNEPYNCNVRAAGVETGHALVPLDEVLLEWADCFVVAEQRMVDYLDSEAAEGKHVYVLNLPDTYGYREDALVEAIKKALEALDFPHADCTTEVDKGTS